MTAPWSSQDADLEEEVLVSEDTILAVKKGAALLDAMQPGWLVHIDLITLDMAEGSCCVLGQVYGDYTDGCEMLDLDYCGPDADEHGFHAPSGGRMPDYSSLQVAWKNYLRERLTHGQEEA